eukprot:2476402-Amphidinium_carterae.1
MPGVCPSLGEYVGVRVSHDKELAKTLNRGSTPHGMGPKRVHRAVLKHGPPEHDNTDWCADTSCGLAITLGYTRWTPRNPTSCQVREGFWTGVTMMLNSYPIFPCCKLSEPAPTLRTYLTRTKT